MERINPTNKKFADLYRAILFQSQRWDKCGWVKKQVDKLYFSHYYIRKDKYEDVKIYMFVPSAKTDLIM